MAGEIKKLQFSEGIAVSSPTDLLLGAAVKNKWDRRILTADVTSNTADILDLKFQNLVVGRIYKLTYNVVGVTNSTDDVFTTTSTHDGNTILNVRIHNDTAPAETHTHNAIQIFEATTTSLLFTTSSVSVDAFLAGNSTLNETWVLLEELNNYDTESNDLT